MKQFNHYVVRGVLPANTPGNDKAWKANKRWGVVSSTPELAGMQVRLSFPHVIIHTISHVGKVDMFHEVCQEAGC